MEPIRVPAVVSDPPQVSRSQLERAAKHQRLCARIGMNIGVGLMIMGALLLILGILGTEEFVADRGRIVSMPAGALFGVAGALVVWITRPILIR